MKRFILSGFLLLYLVAMTGCEVAKTGILKINDQNEQNTETKEAADGQLANADTTDLGLDVIEGSNNELEYKKEEESSSVTDENIKQKNQELSASGKDVVEITEKMYVSYINEIYTNPDEYLGKKIIIEGMYTADYYEETDTTYYYVYRVGPGCCGNDGSMCGFEFTTKGDLPTENEWIKVEGTLKSYLENGQTYLTLNNSKLTVKQERGKENVNQ